MPRKKKEEKKVVAPQVDWDKYDKLLAKGYDAEDALEEAKK